MEHMIIFISAGSDDEKEVIKNIIEIFAEKMGMEEITPKTKQSGSIDSEIETKYAGGPLFFDVEREFVESRFNSGRLRVLSCIDTQMKKHQALNISGKDIFGLRGFLAEFHAMIMDKPEERLFPQFAER